MRARRARRSSRRPLVAAGDGVYAWTITVVPLTAEAGYLTVIVSGDIDGVAQARSVTVSLRSTAAPSRTGARGRRRRAVDRTTGARKSLGTLTRR